MNRPMLAALVALAVAAPRAARAQQDYRVDPVIDGAITGVSAIGIFLLMRVPVDTGTRWDTEIFGSLDLAVRHNFSASAMKLSDGLLAAAVAAPLVLQLDRGIDEDAGRRALIYSEAIAISLFANSLAKYGIQRPRPYTYNSDPRVQEFVGGTGKDSGVSFYSGHASTAFTAAITGSYLFATGAGDRHAKAAVWFMELALAGATANLRVRAGKHYYSDILVGALAGGAIGVLVPMLHADEGGIYEPSALEWGAMAGGLLAGGLVSQLLPLHSNVLVRLDDRTGRALTVVPMVLESGAGLALSGAL